MSKCNAVHVARRSFCGLVQRCSEFVRAREAFERVVDSSLDKCVGDLSVVEFNFVRWMDKYRVGRFARLVGSSDFVFVKLFNRFMLGYVERCKRMLRGLYAGCWDFMLTLTMKPMGLLKDEFAYCSGRFTRVRAWLYKRFGHFSYFKILEITKVGRPHLHVLVRLGDIFKKGIPLDWCKVETESIFEDSKAGVPKVFMKGLRDVWGCFVKVRRCWNGFRASSYCMKYLNKVLESKEGFDLRFASLLFASNCRLFGMSQDLRVLQCPICKKWSARWDGVRFFCKLCGASFPKRPVVKKPGVPVRRFDGS